MQTSFQNRYPQSHPNSHWQDSKITSAGSSPGWSPRMGGVLLWQPRGYSCGPQTYLIFFSVSCSRAEWQSSISLTKSRFLFSAFSRSCLALSRSCTSCSTCPLPGDRWDTAVSLTDLPRLHCPTATSWNTLQLRPFYQCTY